MKPYIMSQLGLDAPRLPFLTNALEPVLNRQAVEMHYSQQHAYFQKTRELVEEAVESGAEELIGSPRLQDVVRYAAKRKDTPGPRDLFSQAAQAWNHAFLWLSFKPQSYAHQEIERNYAGSHFAECADRGGYASLEEVKKYLVEIATDSFGSGWAWLVMDGDTLAVRLSENAGTFLESRAGTPLLVIDLWEHAYFIDYGFDRAEYVRRVASLLDWNWAADVVHQRIVHGPDGA
jgi:Fe-Mn family superoxide dismutase